LKFKASRYLLHVIKRKKERERELRSRWEQRKLERQKQYSGFNLYVKNLADNIDDDRLLQEFGKFGHVTSGKIMSEDGKSKGFGFICFQTSDDATKAMTEMNGRMLEGKPLYVALAQRKDVRRSQLEAQYAARAVYGQPQMPFGPPGGPFMYGVPQRPMMFPQMQMVGPMGRGWQGPSPMMGMPPTGMQYQLHPMGPRGGGPGRGGRGRGRGGGRGGQGPQGPQGPQGQPVRYGSNVRNQPQAQGGPQPRPPQQRPAPAPATQIPGPVPQPAASAGGQAPLTIKQLAAAPEEEKKQMIGERLFPLVMEQQPELAGKITGMLLEMDMGELIHLLESRGALNEKIEEALQVLQQHGNEEADEEEDEEEN